MDINLLYSIGIKWYRMVHCTFVPSRCVFTIDNTYVVNIDIGRYHKLYYIDITLCQHDVWFEQIIF